MHGHTYRSGLYLVLRKIRKANGELFDSITELVEM